MKMCSTSNRIVKGAFLRNTAESG